MFIYWKFIRCENVELIELEIISVGYLHILNVIS